MEYRYIKGCRICGSGNLNKYLDLGKQPLANALLSKNSLDQKKYPLQVLFCNNCALSQLSVVVDPRVLYSDYPYHSSVSKTFKKHCRQMASDIKKLFPKTKPLVVDIASNDGCLLEQFKNEGYYVMGIEPCKKLAKKANERGISTIDDFWNKESAARVPACNVITATNVFAHVDDVKEFVRLAKNNLKMFPKGVLVIEVPYLANLIKHNQFDTIYHEHLSYFLFTPLKNLFSSLGIPIFRVEEHSIHGGSLRIYASQHDRDEEDSVMEFVENERNSGLLNFLTYKKYSKEVNRIKESFMSLLHDMRAHNKTVAAYGASAKGISLMNYCGVTNTDISYIADDTPEKQGKFAPGCGIPIVSRDRFDTNAPDYMVLTAWNFSSEMKEKTADYRRRGGRYIVPIPNVRIE